MKKIGVLIIATNKYIKFFNSLENEIYMNFLPREDVNIILFTNKLRFKPKNNRTQLVYINHEKWPLITLKRFEFFEKNSQLFENFDYLFYLDVDMKIVNEVDSSILSNLIGTIHPGYHNKSSKNYPTSNNKRSKAFISEEDKLNLNNYYAGGFFGGSKDYFLNMTIELNENIKEDIKNNEIPQWHDESHLNKFFSINNPTKELPISYCFIQSKVNKSNRDNVKIIALDKNHLKFRSNFYLLDFTMEKVRRLKNSIFK